jgi:hypothetical protein
MLSRALSLAAASLIGCLMATVSQAQQNLDAGKSPLQIFNGNCSACHKSARGLLRTVAPGSLPGFLRQHYTTGSEMAQMLSGYVISNGAGAPDARLGGKPNGKPDANLRPDAPIGVAAPDSSGKEKDKDREKDKEQAQRPERKPSRLTTAPADPDAGPPEGASAPRARKPRAPRPEEALRPDGAQVPAEAALTPNQKPGKRKHGEPPKPVPEIVARPEPAPAPMPERAIDAAVPVPEPVAVPPPTAADIRPEPDAGKAAADKASVDKPVAAAPAPAPPPPPLPPSSTSAAVAPPSGPPAPPISQ